MRIEITRSKDKEPYDNIICSAIWYALDDYYVADVKEKTLHTKKGK